ncbi:hypothetical protein C7H09_05160 [Marinobacter fuscus]|uniref:Uncharacterized protein n=1 Tax=Marinobacter fuscus TaxID=2109942 RepID=A0A2T1KPI7_9GAMM|nr:hypothetical protein [Marinobacter fuscus]PSF11948.1 hypothetical protein C7H09_05160 [Marinobacter fuscus]
MRIEDMSIDQLLELNQTICRRIDELRDRENLQALSQLRVGLKVTFEAREGPVLGIVTKINRKSVIVLAEDGTKQYKVSPELLRPLRDVK